MAAECVLLVNFVSVLYRDLCPLSSSVEAIFFLLKTFNEHTKIHLDILGTVYSVRVCDITVDISLTSH